MSAGPQLSYDDTAEILVRLGSVAEDVVLIGGQALHFWVSQYAARDSFLSSGAPFTSKDVDFCGDAKKARAAAEALGGEVCVPSLDDATPSTALVRFEHSGARHEIDFLDKPDGIARTDVERMSLLVYTGIGEGRFRVLPPILCMESRVCNTSLPGYTTPHALRQLRASIVCARELGRPEPGLVTFYAQRLPQMGTILARERARRRAMAEARRPK